ncbi:MAG: OmpA family protein [Thermodesulfobacteriota bacterium]|nr:OmpA family protein [Thermodesulfobacteriota bacterium]
MSLISLDHMIPILKGIDLSSLRMVIVGYTDNTGSLEINTRLARGRAETVSAYFRESRIIPKEMATGGRPLCCYVLPNDIPEGRAKNRRAEIWIEPIAEEAEDEKPE